MPTSRFRGAVLALWLFSAAVCLRAQTSADDTPVANPARPTVATPATLTPVGYLQFENGMLYATGSPDFSSRYGINQVTKLTVHPRLELLVQSEPWVHTGLGREQKTNSGDVFLGLQGVVLPGNEKRPTIAVSYVRHVYAGSAPDIDIGTPEHGLLLLVSADLHGFHFDINGMLNEQRQNGVGRAQFGQTLSISRALKKLTLSSEIWHFSQPLIGSSATGNLWAIAYTVRPNLVIDGGLNRGLTGTSTRWEGFTGFTYVLPHRLWGRHKRTR
jgi:hypothetical protein